METFPPEKKSLEQARSIYRTVRQLQRHILAVLAEAPSSGACASMDITIGQLNMLYALRDQGPCTVKELAEALNVSAPSVSTMVDRLVDARVVAREQSQVDRRAVEIRLLPKADEAMDAFESVILRGITEIIEGIGPDHTAQWLEVYDRVSAFLTEKSASQPVE